MKREREKGARKEGKEGEKEREGEESQKGGTKGK